MLRAHERCRLPQSVKHYSTGCGGSLHASGMKTHLSLKSLKTPTVLPSKDELVHLGKEGTCCEGVEQRQPCVLHVPVFRCPCRGRAGEMWLVPHTLVGPSAPLLALGLLLLLPPPREPRSIFWGVPGCKVIGVLSPCQRVCYQTPLSQLLISDVCPAEASQEKRKSRIMQ